MSLPPSDFAQTFRALIVPRLRPMIQGQGLLIALGLAEYIEAQNAVMAEAGRLGAYRLPIEHFHALEEWIGAAIVKAEDDHTRKLDERRAMVERSRLDVELWDRRTRQYAAR
tara:strand:+ start:2389 stop:2724 length:336 start_codon:yes stop_codon:yes gene_type:complete